MVNKILTFQASVAADAVSELIDEYAPKQNHQYEILEIWTDQNANVALTLSVDETRLFSSVPGDSLPGPGEGLVYDLSLRSGEQLQILADELAGAAQEVGVYILVNVTGPDAR